MKAENRFNAFPVAPISRAVLNNSAALSTSRFAVLLTDDC